MVCVEGIYQQHERDTVHNERMRKLADRAIDNCVTSRMQDKKPVKDKLLMENAEYAAFISKASGRIKPGEQRGPMAHATRPPSERQKE